MDIPRHILRTLFTDTKFPLIQHHLDSFNDMLDVGIPTLVKVSNPFELELRDGRYIRVYIGGKEGTAIRYLSPVEDDGGAIVPHACRLDNKTYALTVRADIEIEYVFGSETVTKKFPDVFVGRVPLMLRSNLCYLSAMDGYEIGECRFELGGYFIIDGAEKVLLTQELLGNNMYYAGVRKRQPPKMSLRGAIEKEEAIKVAASYEEPDEYYVGIRTMSEDGARGPYSHFLVVPSETSYNAEIPEAAAGNVGRDNRLAIITIPGFGQPVPVLSLFRAFGVTSDRDVYDTILAGVPDKDRLAYDDLFAQIVLSHETFLSGRETTDLDVMVSQAHTKSRAEVVRNLHEMCFTHVEGSTEDTGALFRRKAYVLGHMMRMAMDVALERRPPSDRDSMPFKRMKTSGVLMFEEFRRIYREMGKSMLLAMDSRVQFEAKTYEGKGLVNLVDPENVGYFWKGWRMLNEFSKSFKGQWSGRAGVAQELARPSYAAVIHHLRKTDLQIDKTASTAPPRRLYATQFGIMCPADSPDGSDIGYKKSLTILARVSTGFPATEVKMLLMESGMVRELADIHPSTWVPGWTRIFVNSDIFGVCVGDTEALHRQMLVARRTGKIGSAVSLAWNRLKNEYTIWCDAGRPIRPVYREGTLPDSVRNTKTWAEIANNIDYLDAGETDSVRISMTPFDPQYPSEIHMSFNLSALTNLVPFMDHNPATRTTFSIAQQKQAASWYHTNYMKRFDTIAMMACCPQKPQSQTWLYNEVMGAGGCLGYGENAIVAITMYGGHNQEDSVLLNKTALKRGMFRTMYYHSYDIVEEFIGQIGRDKEGQFVGPRTEIANPLKNESVRRKEGLNYEMLDADGIVKLNSIVDENTVLVGMLSPVLSATGQTTGYRDVSTEPKRGQHGRIDAVYRYSTDQGLRGVKIRIAEERSPTIGDKMASRHSQKGTVGMLVDEEDMPFTGKGIRPDLIFNPHGIPTRMTIGQFLEAASNKLGVDLGALVDATPFTVSNRVLDLKTALMSRGFEPHGSEVLYNGETGEMMEADIFMGPIYYQRLKHMVEDKINYRDTGPKTMLTHQPTQGRGNEGGLRIGEMERDALMAHGMSKFLTESMMERSDKATVQFDKEAGRLDTSRDRLSMPYSTGLFTREVESMHITMRMKTQ